MKVWNQYPLVRIVVPFIVGIIVANNIEAAFAVVRFFPAMMIICTLAGIIMLLPFGYGFRWIPGALVFMIFFLFGLNYIFVYQKNDRINADDFIQISDSSILIAEVIEEPAEKAKSYKSILRIKNRVSGDSLWQTDLKCLVYLEKDSVSTVLRYGDQIIFTNHLNPIDPPGNPGQFDYKKFMERRGIYTQLYLPSGSFLHVPVDRPENLFSQASEIRKQFISILTGTGLKGNELSVAAAMLVGTKEFIDPDLLSAYSGAGAVHVLCVSGMHVGIIYIISFWFLSFLGRIKYGRNIRIILVVLFIWAFAFVAGLAPSVCRAATMFSFVALSRLVERKISIYNTLAASALVLLLINPNLLSFIGFQLSYLAVLGIVMFQPLLFRLFEPSNYLAGKIWALITVSIGAQLGTFPLSVSYFHTFPLLFMVTNLVVIPMLSVIIYLSLAVLITSFIPAISEILSFLLGKIIFFLNQFVWWIDNQAFSKLENISFSIFECVLIYALIAAISAMLLYRNRKTIFIVLMILLLLTGYQCILSMQSAKLNRVYIYNINRELAIDFLAGQKSWLFCDSTLMSDQKAIDFNIKPNHIINGIKTGEMLVADPIEAYDDPEFLYRDGFFCFGGCMIKLLVSEKGMIYPGTSCDVDILILSGGLKADMESLIKTYSFRVLLIASDNPPWKTGAWITDCDNLGIPYYDIRSKGAFCLDLNSEGKIRLFNNNNLFSLHDFPRFDGTVIQSLRK